MADPFATVSDLEARWRPLTPAETATATTLLDDASAQVRVECPDVDDRLTATPPTLDASIPRRVVCAMVKRAMLAPVDQAPMTQMQQTAGPFSQSGTFVNPTGDLYLTKTERRLLGCSRQRAASIPTEQRPCDPDAPPWWVTTP